ncbi:outer membrane protein transport protein [Psychrobacter sp. NG27]|uniref:outer membrane protein transport protein n=1 Tax=Psychrobacter sp. NG27 TaxID=2781966 RepID=UPI0018DF8BA1|nr:outer membrane protein transport protein [Psychrobacter sp. NG27]MBI0425453.1 outer membrane protein transport protein [Psychrobacter sp. NG27]
MRATFHLKTLTVAVAALSVASMANAAGLDRSGQDVTAFLQDGTYAEAVYTYIDADVTGKDTSGNKIGDIAESYDFFRYGVKADVNDTFSVGILYDEPFGAAADYTGTNNFVGAPTDAVNNIIASSLTGTGVTDIQGLKALVEGTQTQLSAAENRLDAARAQVGQAQAAVSQNPALESVLRPQIEAGLAGIAAGETQLAAGQAQLNQLERLEGFADERLANDESTNVEVRTESLTGILGAKFGTNKEFQVYGGPVVQRVKADIKLRGSAYGAATGYTAHLSPDQDYGYLAGISYSKPEIALKAALTYRSEIDHSMNIDENYPVVAALGGDATQGGTIDITTPESVNFDFQTGINPTTLATAKVRWVPWSDFSIVPPLYNEVSKRATLDDKGLSLVSYDDDQWVVELGLAKRLTPALAVSGNVGWDSGAGNPVTSLGPIEGYYSAGLGAKYNVTENWAISAGGKYLWFGDAEGQIPTKTIVSDFESNDGYVVGVKVSYQAQ